MELYRVNNRKIFESGCQVAQAFQKVEVLIQSLEKKKLPEEIVREINEQIMELDLLEGNEKDLVSSLTRIESRIFLLVNRKLGLVREKFYITMWMPLGMATFGLPIGLIFFAVTGNAAFIGIGLPLGMAAGAVLGNALDKKAKQQNRILK